MCLNLSAFACFPSGGPLTFQIVLTVINHTAMNTTFHAGRLPLVILLFLATGLTAQTSVKEDILRADKQFDLYAYNLALRTYEQVLKQEPNNAHALARTGDCYFQLNRPQDALTWYDRAAARGDADPEVMFRYGKALMYTGDYVGAKKWFVLYSETKRDLGQHYARMCDFALQNSGKTALFQALDEPLNTTASDFGPAFYGNRVVYNSARTDIQRKTAARTNADWAGSAFNQLYVTQRNPGDNYLQNPAFLRSDLQNNFNEGPVSFSGDGRRVVFCRNNFIDGTRQIAEKGLNMSLHIADVADGNWLNEKPFPYNGSNHSTGFPNLSSDGNTLYFASNQEGGFGGWDLYVTNWTGNSWSIPRNLGAAVNTPGNEVTPFFDGRNLYFSSDWHNGLGGLDVFRADLEDNTGRNVVHLGTGINSPRDDYGFIFDPNTSIGYLTSNRAEGRGNEDVWQIRKRVDEFVISVTDAQQNPISAADIDFTACNAGVKQTDIYGQYSFAVAAGKADCRITVRKAGYRPVVIPISSAGEKNINAVLTPDYTEPATYAAPSTIPARTEPEPVTYTYPVQNGAIEKYTVYVLDDQGRPLPAAELNLTTCGLGTILTDYNGKGSFYFPKGGSCNLVIRKTGLEDVTIPVNDQTRKEMSIAMSGDKRTKFSGLVLDANTRRPIQGTVVTARSRQGGHETLASASASGQYSLMLRPYQIYDITYGHDGYQNYTSTLQTERALQVDMELSPILLVPTATYTAPATYSTTQPASGGMISLAELSQTSAPATTTSPVTTLSKQQPATSNVTGYAVQISANPEKFTESKIRKYDDLTTLGNLYSVQEGKMNKLRLGVYPTREEANDVLEKVNKTHKDAFVVWETQADQSLVVGKTAPAPAEYSTSIAAKGVTTPPATKTALPAASPVRFAVQVASWPADKAVSLADYTNLQSLGNLYIRPENDRLRVRVGAWDTHERAAAAKAEAVKLGYKDAIVIAEKAEDLPADQPRTGAAPAVSTSKVMTATPVTYSTPGVSATPVSNAKYYIRVCALHDKENFDARKLDGSGAVIEKWPIGDTNMTAIMLTGFPTVEQAMAATDKLRSTGFQDAYIIKDENGKMTKFRY